MLNLMNQCDIVEKQNKRRIESRSVEPDDGGEKNFLNRQFKNNPFSLFSGIIPGTKWCGTGDIATTYSDLGMLKLWCGCVSGHLKEYLNRKVRHEY